MENIRVFFYSETKRHFTAANNAGVTHLEYLKPDRRDTTVKRGLNDDPLQLLVSENVTDDQKNVSELRECYNKICGVGHKL